jgi:CheY-like chemotaxis protein
MARPHQNRILLVEDHPETLNLMEKILRARGYDVSTASTKAQALQQCQSEDFDILLGDIQLPDGDGFDLLREARALTRIKGIAVTGSGLTRDFTDSRLAGYEAHLTKPVDLNVLLRTIEDILDEVTL